MLKRLGALFILPATAAVLYLGAAVWIRREPSPSDAARLAAQGDVLVLLLPSVLLYLLALPFVWRRARHATPRAIASFSSLTFALTLAGLALMMGPLYRALEDRYPMLADQLFFFVFPFAPVVLAILLSLPLLKSSRPPDSLRLTT